MNYIKQTPLGKIEYSENNRITLPKGLPGFESAQFAVWFSSPEHDPIKWFIIEDYDDAVLPLIDPFLVVSDYEPYIPEQIVEILEIESPDNLAVMCVATPRKEEVPTVNLRSPIVINAVKKIALQVILDDDSLPIRYELFNKASEAEPC